MTSPLQGEFKIVLDLRSLTQRDVFYQGRYDEALLERCVRLLPAQCTVLDVGANVGLTTLPLARAAWRRGGRLHAFEPVASNVERLRSNVALNGLQDVVSIWPFGLSSEDGSATISLREDFDQGGTTGNAAILINQDDDKFAAQSIALRSLDSFVAEQRLERLDFVKLDIEGHEDFFLAGASQALRRFQPCIMFEVNKTYYLRRKVDLDQRIAALAPGYTVLRSQAGNYLRWMHCASVDECRRLDNVFLVPTARVDEVLAALNA